MLYYIMMNNERGCKEVEKIRVCKTCKKTFQINFTKSGRQQEFCSVECKQKMLGIYKEKQKRVYQDFIEWRRNRFAENLAKQKPAALTH